MLLNDSSNPAAVDTNAAVPGAVNLTIAELVVYGTVAGLLSVLTTLGNFMVLISFRIEKQLRTISNYFLLSLAVADLMIGVISMPLYTVFLLMGRWPLPAYICDLWLSLDYTMSNASVANLLVISIDRFLSVTRPLTYRANRTPKRASMMVALAWTVSVMVWTPWIYAWPYIEGQRTVKPDQCFIQFLESSPVVTIITAVLAYYVPVTVITILYIRIYMETERRQRDLTKLQAGRQKASMKLLVSQTQKAADYISQTEQSTGTPATTAAAALASQSDPCDAQDHHQGRLLCGLAVAATCCSCPRGESHDNDENDDDEDDEEVGSNSDHHHHPHRNSTTYDASRRNSSSNNLLLRHQNSLLRCHPGARSAQTSQLLRGGGRTDNGEEDHRGEADGEADSIDSEVVVWVRRESFDRKLRNAQTSSPADHPCLNNNNSSQSSRRRFQRENSASSSKDQILPRSSSAGLTTPRSRINNNNNNRKPGSTGTGGEFTPSQSLSTTTSTIMGSKSSSAAATGVKLKAARKKEQRNERKAAKTLSAILFAFIITWTPYNIFTVVKAFQKDTQPAIIPDTIYSIGGGKRKNRENEKREEK